MRLNTVAANDVAEPHGTDAAARASEDGRPRARLVLVDSLPSGEAAAQPAQCRPAPQQSIVDRYRAREVERATSTVYDPSLAETSQAQLAVPSRVVFAVPQDVEAQIVDVLKAPPEHGETLERAFTRKENELRCVFARLTPAEARTLQDRIKRVRAGDIVAELFGRLVQPRRDRLVAFLADARRREALAAARR